MMKEEVGKQGHLIFVVFLNCNLNLFFIYYFLNKTNNAISWTRQHNYAD